MVYGIADLIEIERYSEYSCTVSYKGYEFGMSEIVEDYKGYMLIVGNAELMIEYTDGSMLVIDIINDYVNQLEELNQL